MWTVVVAGASKATMRSHVLRCDATDVEPITRQTFSEIDPRNLVQFREAGVWFCFDRRALRDYVVRHGHAVNPMTRRSLDASVLADVMREPRSKVPNYA